MQAKAASTVCKNICYYFAPLAAFSFFPAILSPFYSEYSRMSFKNTSKNKGENVAYTGNYISHSFTVKCYILLCHEHAKNYQTSVPLGCAFFSQGIPL
jgi:hypothetical protein